MTAGNTLAAMLGEIGSTTFLGYQELQSQGRILALLREGVSVDEAVEGETSCILYSGSRFWSSDKGLNVVKNEDMDMIRV